MGDELAELKAEVKKLHAKLQKVEGEQSFRLRSDIDQKPTENLG